MSKLRLPGTPLNELAAKYISAWMDASRDVVGASRYDAARAMLDLDHPSCTVLEFEADYPTGLEPGLLIARVCMSNLADISIVPGDDRVCAMPRVQVVTDYPVAACMLSQYAGWEVKGENYFAMGSGPMRVLAAKEELIESLGYREQCDRAVGVLEASKLPSGVVCDDIARQCGVEPANLTLLVAPTRSMAGTMQIVARSVETALHKLHELKFDITRVQSAHGIAPMPPPAADDLAAIGRTNDAILYGGQVMLYVTGDDASLKDIGPQTPSSGSRDYGRPFADIFAGYDHDFYQVDPLLFSPAQVTFCNLQTGNTFRFGNVDPDVVRQSFGL